MSAEAREERANRRADLRGPGKAKVHEKSQRKYKKFENQNLPRMKERKSQITSYHILSGQDGLCLRGRFHRLRWICIIPQVSFDLNIQTSK